MIDTNTTNNTLKIVYTYNGKELVIADLLRDHVSRKDLDIASWKAGMFFNATPKAERETVNA